MEILSGRRAPAGLFGCLLLTFGAASAWAQKSPGFDLGSINRAADPCANFYQYACGGWMTANPIPADQSSWGRFDQLQDRNRTVLHAILDAAALVRPNRSAQDQKIGDYYASCMDVAAINQKGLVPLQPELDRIGALRDRKELTALVAHFFHQGQAFFFNLGPEMDPKNSTQVIANLDQGGLSLPDRDYYLKTDEKSVMLQQLQVSGAPSEDVRIAGVFGGRRRGQGESGAGHRNGASARFCSIVLRAAIPKRCITR